MNKDDVTPKMKYQLWWEYLKESDKYKMLCEWFRKREKTPSLTWPKDVSMSLGETFGFFGDIFNNSFDEWWKIKQERDPGIGVVEYSKTQASHEFDSVVKEFFNSHGREPSLTEFKGLFINRVFDHLPGCFNFRVCFHPTMTTKNLADQFSKLIRAKRELPELQNYENEIKNSWLFTCGHFKYDKIKRYLYIYRLKKGMKIGDIIEKYNSENSDKPRFDAADFHTDIRLAKKIVENAEIGCFPGEYT